MATPAVAWFEVTGKDGASLQNFYGKLFDWQINDAGDGSGYGLVAATDKGIGGGIGAAQNVTCPLSPFWAAPIPPPIPLSVAATRP